MVTSDSTCRSTQNLIINPVRISWLGGIITRLKFIIAIIALAVLCVPAFGQTTTEDWFAKGNALYDQGKYDEAIQAYDKAIELDPCDCLRL
jgi:tetratricopeptide (TPR) repeat protein